MRPSCALRRSAISRFARILMRQRSGSNMRDGGAGDLSDGRCRCGGRGRCGGSGGLGDILFHDAAIAA